jgi:hypothetical protein
MAQIKSDIESYEEIIAMMKDPQMMEKVEKMIMMEKMMMMEKMTNMSVDNDEEDKNEPWNRFILVVKPEQSGKTFVMIKKINEFMEDDEITGNITVNFIFCDNSLLLTKQTTTRLLADINEPYAEFSSRNDGKAKKKSSEVRDAIEEGVRNVVCCTNGKRVVDIEDIIRRLNLYNNASYTFKIWLDEADKFDSHIKKTFIPLAEKYSNVEVYMLTATPQPIFETYGEVRTMALENTTIPTYHGWDDCERIIVEDESGGSPVGFARQVADGMIFRGELKPGAKGYVPANTQKRTHHAMRDMFVEKNTAVFVVNGDGIELTLPVQPGAACSEPQRITIEKKTKELHKHICELYNEHNVGQWPCVVTGNICVGRGISIQQPDFMFTFGILSNCSKKAEASQNAGRLKGNFKNWVGYCRPKVYTTAKFDKIAMEYEEQSKEIAKLAFDKNGNSEGSTIVTKTEVKNIVCDKDWDLFTGEFDTLKEANDMLARHGCRCKKSFTVNEQGFIESSITNKRHVMNYDLVVEKMKGMAKTSTFTTKTDTSKYGRMYVAYKDLNDKDSVVYMVRVIKKK